MPAVGPTELIIVLVIALVIFGPKRLPDLGRSLGKGMREFKDSIGGGQSHDDDDEDQAEVIGSTSDSGDEPATTGRRDAK